MDRCEGRRRLREWIGWGAACSFMTSSINVSPSSRARARVPVGGDLPHGHAHRFRLDPMLSCPRESFVWVQGWHRGMRDRLVVACGRGGAPQPAVEELVDALENGVMTTSCVCAFAASLNWVSLRTRLGPIWASATGATETFSSSDLRSTASGALEKRWRSCSSRKTTSKDVRCTPTRCAAAFFSLAACPDLLLRRRTHWGSEIGPCFRKLRGTTDTELVLHVATLVLPVRLRGRPLRPANRLR